MSVAPGLVGGADHEDAPRVQTGLGGGVAGDGLQAWFGDDECRPAVDEEIREFRCGEVFFSSSRVRRTVVVDPATWRGPGGVRKMVVGGLVTGPPPSLLAGSLFSVAA